MGNLRSYGCCLILMFWRTKNQLGQSVNMMHLFLVGGWHTWQLWQMWIHVYMALLYIFHSAGLWHHCWFDPFQKDGRTGSFISRATWYRKGKRSLFIPQCAVGLDYLHLTPFSIYLTLFLPLRLLLHWQWPRSWETRCLSAPWLAVRSTQLRLKKQKSWWRILGGLSVSVSLRCFSSLVIVILLKMFLHTCYCSKVAFDLTHYYTYYTSTLTKPGKCGSLFDDGHIMREESSQLEQYIF